MNRRTRTQIQYVAGGSLVAVAIADAAVSDSIEVLVDGLRPRTEAASRV
jgi:hypothetical protein